MRWVMIISNDVIGVVDSFKYLGSVIQKNVVLSYNGINNVALKSPL